MGREKLPASEDDAVRLQEVGRQVADAISRGEFHRARQLTEEAIQERCGGGDDR